MSRHGKPVVVVADLSSLQGPPPTDVHPKIPCPCTGCRACEKLPVSVREKGLLSLDTGHTQSSVYIDLIHRYNGILKHCQIGKMVGPVTAGLYYDSPKRNEILEKITFRWCNQPPKLRGLLETNVSGDIARQDYPSRPSPSSAPTSSLSSPPSSPKVRRLPTKVAGAAGIALWRLILEALMELKEASASEIADYVRKYHPTITPVRISSELSRNKDKGFQQVNGRWGYWRLTPHFRMVTPPLGIPIASYAVPQLLALSYLPTPVSYLTPPFDIRFGALLRRQLIPAEDKYAGRPPCPICGGNKVWPRGSRDYKNYTTAQLWECRNEYTDGTKCKKFGETFWVNNDLRPPFSEEVVRRSGVSKLSNIWPPSLCFRLYHRYYYRYSSPEDLVSEATLSGRGGDIRHLQTVFGKISKAKWEEFRFNPIVPSLLGRRIGDRVYKYLHVDVTPYPFKGETLYLYVAKDHHSNIVLERMVDHQRENTELVAKLLRMVRDDWTYVPDVVISDASGAIIAAVEEVFPPPRTLHQFDHTHYVMEVNEKVWPQKGENAQRNLESAVARKRRYYGRRFAAIMDNDNPDEAEVQKKWLESTEGIWGKDDVLRPLGNKLRKYWDHWFYFLDHDKLPECPWSTGKIEGGFGDLDKKKNKSKAHAFNTWEDEVTAWILKHNMEAIRRQLKKLEESRVNQDRELENIEKRKKLQVEYNKFRRGLMDMAEKGEISMDEFMRRIEAWRHGVSGLGDSG